MKRIFVFLFLTISVENSPCFAAPAPGVSALLSIVPGLGQVANGDTFEGVAWFTTTVGLYLIPNVYTREYGFNFWLYNMYDAYRDAGANDTGKETAFQNYIANYNPLNLIDPIGAPMLAIAAITPGKTKGLSNQPKSLAGKIIYYTPVGFGEEGFFRGFLFPGLSDVFSSKWIGAFASSALFAAAHLQFSVTGILTRFIPGLLWCWQLDNNNYDLRHNIFTHSWWDILLVRNNSILDRQPNTAVGLSYTLRF